MPSSTNTSFAGGLSILDAADASPAAVAPADPAWPPAIRGPSTNGTATVKSDEFLVVPENVKKESEKPGAATFVMATHAPMVEIAPHNNLPNAAFNGTGWSAWGDICVGSDGKVYCGAGDHGHDVEGRGNVFIYCWDPAAKTLKQIANPNAIAGAREGTPSFSKVHAGILEGVDKKIYFTCTLNDGGRAGEVKWTPEIPGGLIFQYDPATSATKIVGNLKGECTATTLLDRERNIMYCCLEGHGVKGSAGLGAFDLTSMKWLYESSREAVVADRNIALDAQGNVYFNGKDGELWKYDRAANQVGPSGVSIPKVKVADKEAQPTMRSSTPITKQGVIFGTTMSPGRFFRFEPAKKTIEILSPDFGDGDYTTVTVLSPDEKFVYYLPGSHGGAKDIGTPVVQYEIATGRRKVLAFLKAPIEKQTGIVVAGSYGVKISADGSTLYANFNGHARDDIRPAKMNPIGFGLTSFAAIHIPAEER